MTSRLSIKDLLAGLIFIGFGLAFGYTSLTYEVGTALRMGPGYFPLILSLVILLLGVIIAARSFFTGPDKVPLARVPWVGVTLLVDGLVFFMPGRWDITLRLKVADRPDSAAFPIEVE